MVSIVILSFNTSDLLKSCLDSLFKYTSGVDFEVIVVDNNSQDGSVSMVKKNFKSVRLIESQKNLGFAAGVNRGVKIAKGEYILLLNSDTILTNNCIPLMYSYIQRNKKLGVLGGVLVSEKGIYEKSFGDFPSFVSIFSLLFLSKGNRAKHFPVESRHVDWVNGAVMFIDKIGFEKVDGFDENYFMYVEDIDLCFRFKKIGYTIEVFPEAKVVHIGQGSSNKEFAIVQIYKGLSYFFKKNKNTVEYSIVLCMLILKAWISIGIGYVFGKKQLVSTYSKALSYL